MDDLGRAKGPNADGSTSKRQHPRVLVAWKARLFTAQQLQVDAKAVDLSEGGLGLLSPRSVGIAGDVLDLWLAVPTDNDKSHYQGMRVGGRIAFQIYSGEECRIGLQFTRIDAPSLDLLRYWIRHSPQLR